jgi:hypothetical protein
VRDRALPPDHEAFVAAEPPSGRVIVIAPTRAACETIEIAMGLHVETVLEREHGEEIRALARSRVGFGIVAGTGTGKTLAIRPIAEELLAPEPLRVGVVNREREATPETPTWNVIIVTTGIARRWFEDGDILARDTLVVDEIHQTSAELEICLALGKRTGCRFIWLSATVDPTFYARYLGSAAVIHSEAYDPAKAARVEVVDSDALHFLNERFLQRVARRRRGVGVFLPTRAEVEAVAAQVSERFPRIQAAFYHGGEPIRVIRPFLEEGVTKPFLLAMTAAGQSALNIKGLDTVVIEDARYTNVVERGRNVLTRTYLGPNEILQMAGRVHGRVAGGEVFILSDRDIDFASLRPTDPEFQLAGDSERVALTCAALGVNAEELDLPVPLDRVAYRKAVTQLEERGIVSEGRLTEYGKAVEAMPVDRPWAELLVHADDELLPFVAVMAGCESLHRMTREERDLSGLVVSGSDHLTAYNLYADAYRSAGYLGRVYGLPRHLFDEQAVEAWAERRGALIKAIEDAALAVASVYRSLDLSLPEVLPYAGEEARRAFCDLLARVMPFDLVINGETADGQEVRVSKSSVCGSWGAIAGQIRHFADRYGVPRASIEGTQIPMSLVRRYAVTSAPELAYDASGRRDALVLRERVRYFGFELERRDQRLDVFPAALATEARRVLALALARGEAHHPAVRRNRADIDAVREVYRRSGGVTPRLGLAELARLYEEALAAEGVNSMEEFRRAELRLDVRSMVPPEEWARYAQLPSAVELAGRTVPVDYLLVREDGMQGAEDEDGAGRLLPVARLRLPEKLLRHLREEDIPKLDRPVQLAVLRPKGRGGTVVGWTLSEVRARLREQSSAGVSAGSSAERGSVGAGSGMHRRRARRRRR